MVVRQLVGGQDKHTALQLTLLPVLKEWNFSHNQMITIVEVILFKTKAKQIMNLTQPSIVQMALFILQETLLNFFKCSMIARPLAKSLMYSLPILGSSLSGSETISDK